MNVIFSGDTRIIDMPYMAGEGPPRYPVPALVYTVEYLPARFTGGTAVLTLYDGDLDCPSWPLAAAQWGENGYCWWRGGYGSH